jgi:predicted dehydrogenase
MHYRVGLIGAGRIGVEFEDSHARAYKENPNTELLCVFDKKFDKAFNASCKWDIPTCGSDYWMSGELMLDIVSVCTAPQTHLQIVKDMILCHPFLKAIYCEKPITILLEEAREMVEICREKKIILQVNHQRRFGTPVFTYSRGLFNTGTHVVDMLRQYFGDPIKVEKNKLTFKTITININEIDIEQPVFDFKIPTHDLIKRGVEHLVDCLDNGHDSISNGEEGLKTLEVLWSIKKLSRKSRDY